jgi:hypothetical protein
VSRILKLTHVDPRLGAERGAPGEVRKRQQGVLQNHRKSEKARADVGPA